MLKERLPLILIILSDERAKEVPFDILLLIG